MTASVRLIAALAIGAGAGFASRVKSPLARQRNAPGRRSTKSGIGTRDVVGHGSPIGAKAEIARGATTAATRALIFQASSMGSLSEAPSGPRPTGSSRGGGLSAGQGLNPDRFGCLHLSHQVAAPIALHPEMGGGAKFEGFDHVVIDVGVDPGLKELVERRPGGATADEPGLEVGLRAIREFTSLPYVVTMTADQMRSRIAIGLRVYDQHGLADLRRHRTLAGQRSHSSVEYNVRGDEFAHQLHGVHKGGRRRVVGLELALLVARNIEVLLTEVIDSVVMERLAQAILESVTRQHHHDAAHAGCNVPRNHRPARDAVINEYTRARGFPSQHDLLARADQRQVAAARCA